MSTPSCWRQVSGVLRRQFTEAGLSGIFEDCQIESQQITIVDTDHPSGTARVHFFLVKDGVQLPVEGITMNPTAADGDMTQPFRVSQVFKRIPATPSALPV